MSENSSAIDKNKYRKVYLRKRKMLSSQDYDSMNAKLLYHFHSFFEDKDYSVIHSFLSIMKNKEVVTWPMVEWLRSRNKEVVVSQCQTESMELKHYLFEDYTQLKENKFGIPEPQTGKEVQPDQIEAVLVPLIVFDRVGHRVGYGAGYYDRFLSKCSPECKKIGLSLTPPLDEIPFADRHDIPMDYCITPLGVYRF